MVLFDETHVHSPEHGTYDSCHVAGGVDSLVLQELHGVNRHCLEWC